MSSRPVIGIPTQNLQSLGGISADVPPSWVMSHRYIRTLTAEGALPWMTPLVWDEPETLRGIYEELDGVFLPGGADIDPSLYGEERHALCDKSDPPRDRVEVMLVRWALEDRKPIFGICRGLQIINLAHGGTLYQDLKEHFPESIKHDYFPFGGKYPRDHLAHEVKVVDGTRLSQILEEPVVKVNSMHHQGIKRLGEGLVVSATAPDGLIEGIEAAGDHFLVGVQWHPEVLTDSDPRTKRLFAAFIEAAVGYRENAGAVQALRVA